MEKADPNRSVWLNLEFKGGSEDLIRESYRLLKQYSRESKVIWGHPDNKLSQLLTKIDPTIKRTASPSEVHRMFLMYWTGMLPFKRINFQTLWMPMLTPSFHANLKQQYGSSKYKNVGDGDNWKYRLRIRILETMINASGPLFQHLQKRGVLIMIGVPNKELEILECLKVNGEGVDCIMTDRPSLLKDVLQKEFA